MVVCLGCGDFFSNIKAGYRFGDDVSESTPKDYGSTTLDAGPRALDGGIADEDMELEELEMEDPDALTALIFQKLAAMEGYEADGTISKPDKPDGEDSRALLPSAHWNWKLSKEQCLAQLRKAEVRVVETSSETAMVTAPLL